jgi:hypothetical protein
LLYTGASYQVSDLLDKSIHLLTSSYSAPFSLVGASASTLYTRLSFPDLPEIPYRTCENHGVYLVHTFTD